MGKFSFKEIIDIELEIVELFLKCRNFFWIEINIFY